MKRERDEIIVVERL